MIFNRTQEDVDEVLDIRKKYVEQGYSFTDEQIQQLERGTITINTLNRIETKQDKLKGLFNDMGYWNTQVINKEWNYTQIFDVVEFQRIIDNLSVLRNAFFVYKDTPNIPPVSYHYNDINALEKILYDLDDMINDVKNHYKECGTFECGEE